MKTIGYNRNPLIRMMTRNKDFKDSLSLRVLTPSYLMQFIYNHM